MGIFNEFFKKEKPVFTGSRFGFGKAAATGGEEGLPKISGASGGTLVAPNPGGYELRHFPSNANFAFSSAEAGARIHVLIVGGGGSAGFGGGGAGGVAYVYNLPVPSSPATYPIAIGAGGVSSKGGNTAFQGHPVGTITANGGGHAGNPQPGNINTRSGQPGGSGGAAGHSNPPNPTAGTTTQPTANSGVASWPDGQLYQYGRPGGVGDAAAPWCCEGGGGGGAIGPSPLTSALPVLFRESGTYRDNAAKNVPGDGNGGGDGGNGITFGWIPNSLGDGGYFAGGGGGSYAPTGGGGQGGGGDGAGGSSNNPAAVAGQANTGGGGGGGNGVSPSGGSGIALVYYVAA